MTGTSVLAIKYKDGVLMACDTLACYGSTKRYKNIERMKIVGKHTVVGFTGELSDFDYISTLLDELEMTDFCHDDDCPRTPKEIYNYLVRVMYNRRNKFDPLWNSLARLWMGLRGKKTVFRVRRDDWAALRGRSRGDWVREPFSETAV